MHKEKAVKSSNKHLQCGPLCVESYRQILYFLRPFFSGLVFRAVYDPWCRKCPRTQISQIASGGAFLMVTEKLRTDLAKTRGPPIWI